ncbi:Pheromone P-factor receptor [Lecanosticta acicola]|uniref:Pheromone P-factor receptor n=1 Tax=Lecanosticta acicola TaxID=111012 RepID=A0AAI9EDD8_9PEZI|nr:Pheromone P-factor receptor [Lecanosticta acicola]
MADAQATGLASAAPFDPYSQTFVLIMPDGETQAAIRLSDVFFLQTLAVSTAIIYAIQIGVCALLLLVLLLMTKPDKRRSVVFILNIASLVFLLLRAILLCQALNGPLYNFYNWVNTYYAQVGDAADVTKASEVFSFLSIAATELSMLFQTQIVCCTIKTFWRHLISTVCILVALVTISVRFAAMVVNIKWGILDIGSITLEQQNTIDRLSSGFNICTMISIIVYSSIFCAKLGHAIYQRRKMGMKQFGPMQIIFVMGCQTLFIPVIFGIISYWVLVNAQLYSFMPVVVAVFLPLSGMWASTSTNGNNNIAAPQQWQQRKNTAAQQYSQGSRDKQLLGTAGTSDTLVADGRAESFSGASPSKHGHVATVERDSIDLEMAKMGHQVKINRSYSVRSD